MKILCISKLLDIPGQRGWVNKMMGQVKGLGQNGQEVYYILSDEGQICLFNADGQKLKSKKRKEPEGSSGPIRKWEFHKALISFAREAVDEIEPEIVYIRRIVPLGADLLSLIEKWSCKRGLVVVWEIPTYPYFEQYLKAHNFTSKIVLFFDMLNWSRLKKLVDLFVFFGEEGRYGDKFYLMANGIDTESVPLRKGRRYDGRELHILGLGHIRAHHGFDRVIRGIGEYANSALPEVHFHIVGDGNEVPKLKGLTDRLGLESYVHFHGLRFGSELDEFFDSCHVAAGCLGDCRRDIGSASALKTREYCARGIPFMTDVNDPDFNEEFKYKLHVARCEAPINIRDVIEFVKSVNLTGLESCEMREYAINHLGWTEKMGRLIPILRKQLLQKKNV